MKVQPQIHFSVVKANEIWIKIALKFISATKFDFLDMVFQSLLFKYHVGTSALADTELSAADGKLASRFAYVHPFIICLRNFLFDGVLVSAMVSN